MYPPIHIGNRRATRELDFQGRTIPKGMRVLYSIYLSHHDPRYWREPERFCPERFAPDSADKPPPFAYLPFGGGPRFCIGAAFAQAEAQAILARLLQQFEFEPVRGTVRAHMGATLEPRPGVRMRARRS
jgi:cytochrome P450